MHHPQIHGHLVSHLKHQDLASDNTLHVVGVVSNPARWNSRLRLFRKWRDEMLATPGVALHVVEGVYGDHRGECAPEDGQSYNYLQLKLDSELWLKENMINIGVKNLLPANWRYLNWCDTDLHFRNPNWAHGTMRALQTYNVVQPWSHGVAVLADGSARTPFDISYGFLASTGKKMSWGRHQEASGYAFAHCGYSWACTRYWWENVEKLIDFCIIGSADHHMCWGIADKIKETVDGRMHQSYKDLLHAWAAKAHRASSGMVGYVPGVVEHGHHGPLKGRAYGERWQILVDLGFNPQTDLAYNGQGVLQYVGPHRNKLMARMLSYNRTRNEDSIDS